MHPQVDGLTGAGVDGTEVGLGEHLGAHDVRHDYEHDVVVVLNPVMRAEEIFQDGNGAEAWDPSPVVLRLVIPNATQNAGLPLAQPDHLIHDPLADDGLSDAADGYVAALRSDLDFHV